MFGRSLGDVVSDNNKVPVLTQAGNDYYYLVVNTQTKATKKISASIFKKLKYISFNKSNVEAESVDNSLLLK